jgi:hypothetical protein
MLYLKHPVRYLHLEHLLLLFFLVIASCKGNNHINDPVSDTLSPPAHSVTSINYSRIISSFSAQHFFSDPGKMDSFSLTLYGESLFDGVFVFSVVNFNRVILYRDTFGCYDLVCDADPKSDREREEIVFNNQKHFFDAEYFSSPAIRVTDTMPQENQVDIVDWDLIHADTSAIGFEYTHGYEGIYRIAFSKKKSKVVTYYESD